MSRLWIFVFSVAFSVGAFAADDVGLPKFSDYIVRVYGGKFNIPSYYVKVADVWRDDNGRVVAAPSINFAGKYYVGLHSCGAGCRYYTLSDLMAGKDSRALDMFSSDGGVPSKTSDGRAYITELVTKPDSKLMIARYHVESVANQAEECRERFFTLDETGEKVTPVSRTIRSCRDG